MKQEQVHTDPKASVTLDVDGMTCNNCALNVSKVIEREGGREVDVNFSTAEARFQIADEQQLPSIIKGIERLGYSVSENEEGKSPVQGVPWVEKLFYFCLAFTLPLFGHMFIPWSVLDDPWVQLSLCIPVYIVGMGYFGKSAFYSLRSRVPNMDVLITLGASAAFFYSLTGTILQLGPTYQFYETAAMILTLVLLGNVLEHRSVQRTTSAVRELANLQPNEAKLVVESEDGKEQTKPIDYKDIKVGQTLLVNAGDKIPVDGTVIWGTGTVDEAMITGESTPIEKDQGDEVIGSTILQGGNLKIRASAVGQNTVLAGIIDLVKNAQKRKPAIQKLADKVSSIFVPVVICITLLTFVLSFWIAGISLQQSLMNSVAVLVIACPCAMGLATPTAVMVGIGRAAQNGILIKQADVLERTSTIQNIVFDKTGTLTTGRFALKRIQPLNGEMVDDIKSILVGLERHSSHPIAKSLVQELNMVSPVEFESVHEERGIGVKGNDRNGNEYQVGSYSIAKALTDDRSHNLYLTKNDDLIAYIDIEDEIKPGAEHVIEWLKSRGITTYLVSGDSEAKCQEVAKKLGIDKVQAEQLPDQKLEFIEQLSKQAPTAMVGDGINDAPALSRATLGISLSNATQVAVESAQIILLRGDLSYLKKAFKVSQHTLTTIKQNLFWAFFYNVLAIPVAAVGLLSPMIAALSMAFSDVIVIGNSLRLRIKKIFN